MLNICSDIFDNLDLPINVNKCHCIRIGPRHKFKCELLQLSNVSINWVDSIKYLGITICSSKSFKCSFSDAKGKFFRSANVIFGRLSTNSSPNVLLKLITTNSVSALMYGTAALSLKNSDIADLSRAYDSVFVKMFKVKTTNTIRQCQYYSGFWPVEIMYDFNRFNF